MSKKISFVKLIKRSKGKPKPKPCDDNRSEECAEETSDGRCDDFDVNYDRLSTNTDTNQTSDAKTTSDGSHLIRFRSLLLKSFRNKFKKNKIKQKVPQIVTIDPNDCQTQDSSASEDLSEPTAKSSSDSVVPMRSKGADDSHESHPMSSSCPSDETSIDSRTNERQFSLVEEIERIVRNGWYWGPITRVEAEDKLRDQTDGSFLVRDSSDDHYLFSLTFRSFGRTLHTRIEYTNGLFSFYSNRTTDGNTSLIDLIDESMTNSENGVFCYSRGRSSVSPSFPVRLTRPVSRFNEVRSLQFLCKFVIRQSSSFSQIQSLPLPKSIKGFIENTVY